MNFYITEITPETTDVTAESIEEDKKVYHWNCTVNTELNECTSAVCGDVPPLNNINRIPTRVYSCSLKFICKLMGKFKKNVN